MSTIPFWINEPTILFNKTYIFELWPNNTMSYEQKNNAISRIIILLTILGYILTRSINILITGVITLIVICIVVNIHSRPTNTNILENFNINKKKNDNNIHKFSGNINNEQQLMDTLKTEFKEGTKKNPFSNVLLTEINSDPERKAAPPAFNNVVNDKITKNVKKAVQMLNPDMHTNKQLFGDKFQEFQLEQSNRQFYSMPNTRVTSDQGAFAQYLYNDIKYSGKENTPEGSITRIANTARYNLY